MNIPQRRHERGKGGVWRVLLIPTGSMVEHSIPECHRRFATVLSRACAMMDGPHGAILHYQPTLVANRHGLAPAGFSNDTGQRLVAFHHGPCAARSSSLLFN